MPVENLEFQYEAGEMGQWVRKLAMPDKHLMRWRDGSEEQETREGNRRRIQNTVCTHHDEICYYV